MHYLNIDSVPAGVTEEATPAMNGDQSTVVEATKQSEEPTLYRGSENNKYLDLHCKKLTGYSVPNSVFFFLTHLSSFQAQSARLDIENPVYWRHRISRPVRIVALIFLFPLASKKWFPHPHPPITFEKIGFFQGRPKTAEKGLKDRHFSG